MGKSKKKKFRASKQEPTGLASVKETELSITEEFMPPAHGTVASVIEEVITLSIFYVFVRTEVENIEVVCLDFSSI